jgi:hypothetical protein
MNRAERTVAALPEPRAPAVRRESRGRAAGADRSAYWQIENMFTWPFALMLRWSTMWTLVVIP